MTRYSISMLLMLSIISGLAVAAGPGTLDPTFGKGGIVVTSFGNDIRPIDAVLQNDEKLVVVGGLNDFRIASEVAFVVRYHPDGTLDAGFGRNGLAVDAVTNFQNEAEGVVIQADGKIIILMRSTTADGSSDESVLVRFNSDGSRDLKFGNSGRVVINFPHPQFFTAAADVLLLQPDGKVLVAGAVTPPRRNPSPTKTVLARFNTTGTADTTFGTAGVSEITAIGAPVALALLSDGSILAVNVNQQTAQFTSTGALISRIIGGTVIASTHPGVTIFRSDAKFLVAGGGRGPSGRRDLDVAVHLFEPTGNPVLAFQSPLFDFGAGGPYSNLAQAIAFTPNGKIAVGGISQATTFDDELGVARLEANGALDARFGKGGTVVTTFPRGGQVLAIVSQPDEKIVAVGQKFSGDTAIPVDLALVRYLGQ
jgi:uncharacterized delta-60 repeat protein